MTNDDLYQQLREKVHQYSIGMAASDSGIEIAILKRLFTEEEAGIYMAMTDRLESPKSIAKRLNRDEKEVAALLQTMTGKGLTFPKTENGVRFYAAAPFMHGFYEHQAYIGSQDKELIQMMQEYVLDEFRPKYAGMRTVPLKIDIKTDLPVLPYDDVKKIIESKDRIGLIPCACHDHTELMGKNCTNPRDVCLVFDFYGEYIIEEMKLGRWITREEALKVLAETDEAGLVHQTGGNYHTTEVICNCCINCCGGLRKIKAMPKPARAIASNYYASIESEECIACELCLDRCPMDAITVDEETAVVNRDRCIGCGLCISTCPSEAIMLNAISEPKLIKESYQFLKASAELAQELEEEKKSL